MPNGFCLIAIFNGLQIVQVPQWISFFYRNTIQHCSIFQHLFGFRYRSIYTYWALHRHHFLTLFKLKREKFKMKNQKFDEFVEWNRMYTCKIEPRARSAFEQFSFNFVTSKSLSNAPFVSLIRKYKIPISVRLSTFSVVILKNKKNEIRSGHNCRWRRSQSIAFLLRYIFQHFNGFR